MIATMANHCNLRMCLGTKATTTVGWWIGWKPSAHLDTSMYLKQCGYHPSDRAGVVVAHDNSEEKHYECGDSTCYKILDPMEFCNLLMAALYDGMPGMMAVGGIMFLILLWTTFDSCKKKKKRSQQKRRKRNRWRERKPEGRLNNE